MSRRIRKEKSMRQKGHLVQAVDFGRELLCKRFVEEEVLQT